MARQEAARKERWSKYFDEPMATEAGKVSSFGFDLGCSACCDHDRKCRQEAPNPEGYFLVEVRPEQLQRSMASGCEFCSLIYKTIIYYMRHSILDALEPDEIFILCLKAGRPLELRLGRPDLVYPRIRLYAPPDARPAWDTLGTAREMGASYGAEAYIELAKSWLTDCVNHHGQECYLERVPQTPSRIIYIGDDNADMRLLEVEGAMAPYAALSHCWGMAQPTKMASSTLSRGKQRLDFAMLPATFKDAVTVTRGIGLRYLWSDSICIIQDDKRDWEVESAKMGSIFEGAHVVIAASLSYNPDWSFLAPRQNKWTDVLELNYRGKDGRDCLVKAKPIETLAFQLDPVDKRAWTFQEQKLANRLLRFSASELFWYCRASSHCECDLRHPTVVGRYNSGGQYCYPVVESTPSETFRDWRLLITAYTSRQLTEKSDLLPALSGFAAYVQNTTNSEYLAGLWKDDLLMGLYWSAFYLGPDSRSPGVRLPISSLRTMDSYRAPTFSWASIEGFVSYDGTRTRKVSETDAAVLEAWCILEGANPFGEVTDGRIRLEAAMVQASVTVEDDDDTTATNFWFPVSCRGRDLTMTADLPLVECLAQTESGGYERTLKRASAKDVLLGSVIAPIFCVSLFHMEDDERMVLVVGRSSTKPGAFERLGVIRVGFCTQDRRDEERITLNEWFANAQRHVIEIV